MEFKFEIFETADQPVMCIRTHARVEDLQRVIGQSYGAISEFIAANGLEMSGAPYVAYFSMDMQNLDLELGFPVTKSNDGNGIVVPGVIPAGRKATTLFTGPYSQMAPAYDALNAFIKENNWEPTGAAYEYYLTGPETPEAEHKTQIVFPLK